MKLGSDDITNEAINIVRQEVENYDEGLFFINENVAFAMRPLIRKLRKNYWGVFDKDPKDQLTNKDKIWVPLTRLIVDSVRKNADVDSKDWRTIAKRGKRFGVVTLVRNFLRDWAERTYFGEVLNRSILTICIDGTAVWKTRKVVDAGKTYIRRTDVDLLNIFIDPTADSIQDAYRFTERVLMTPEQVMSMDWMNVENVKGQKNLHKTEKDLMHSYDTGSYVDVYEMWGMIPEYLITGKKYKRKENKNVPGRVVISGLQTGDARCHVIERNTERDTEGNIIKPYEEAWYIKVPGRWYGVGPAEMVMNLQDWINRVVNLRIKKNTNASLGLFKVRKNAGVTQQQLTNLVSSGVIKLNQMDDLENLRVDEAGQASYQDEDTAKSWAFEVTSTNQAVRGAPLPASATATSAVIEDRNSKSAFILVKEAVGMFVERWHNRHFIKHVPALMRQNKDDVRIYASYEEMERVREEVIASVALYELEKAIKNGRVPSREELDREIAKLERSLRSEGDLFFKSLGNIVANQIETRFIFTNEELDVSVMTRNLIDLANLIPPEAAEARNDFVATAMDLLGVEVPQSLLNPIARPQAQQPQQPIPTQLGEQVAANNMDNAPQVI